MIPVNRKVGRFEIVRKLARGGMADVYLCRETDSDRTIALKLIEHAYDADTLDSIDAERRGSALQAELAKIDPRVVQIYEVGDADDHFYVAMEYIEGEDLAEIIRRGPLPVERAAETAVEICETLEHAHSFTTTIDGRAYQGIVHGDVKPRNIRIDLQGRVRLLDFGIAKALALSRRLTRNEFGSVQYASPERLDTGEVDWMSDLWSVGVVLYEMVSGQQPYIATTTERLERMIRSRIPPPPAPEPCPAALRSILMKSMDPDPAQRYQSAAEFAADLLRFRGGGEVIAEKEGASEETRRTVGAEKTLDESTRRTTPQPSQAGENTRRTVTAPASATTPQAAAAPVSWLAARWHNARQHAKQVRTAALVAAFAYVGYAMASTYLLWKHGQQLEDQIRTETLSDPDTIWQKWTELSKGSASSVFLYGPRQTVKATLVADASQPIITYRSNDTQPVVQKEWERARGYLAEALTLDPSDNSVHGKLRLCEGHIARIAGTTRRSGALLNESAQKFNQAQQLMPRSPDPQLGLVRLYVYGLKDIDKAYAALQEAQRLGFTPGNRERTQLADGYCERADRLWIDSRKIRGLPQEQDEVQRAADDYSHALDLYRQSAPYGNASKGIARVQPMLEVARARLGELQKGGSWWR